MMTHSRASLPYRSEIDGMRAIAVLAVVLYHFGVPGLSGGFVGVDIFFVISGFLIGGILWREYDQTGAIRLRHFYVRRFRRLAPAFFVMALVTAAVAWAVLLPFEYREFGKALIASTVYLSNVLFYRQAGYFDAASEDKPLLHTWSLAVEEQFYIFLPLTIVLLARWRWGLIGTLVALWAASLAACILLTPSHHSATFYLFPFRAWELLSGVLLAIWGDRTGRRWQGFAALSWLGLALVAVSIVAIPAGPLFPGMLAILPVLGTLLLLANGCGQNGVNRLLCHRVAVFFGQISYSLYLWHWPVFALSTYLRGDDVGPLDAVAWFVLSVGLAWLSWRVVENPIRHATVLSGGLVIGGTALASACLLSLGAWLFVRDGLPGRFDAATRVHIDASADFLQDWSRCLTPSDGPLEGIEVCPIGPEGPPQVVVWGDSHVRAVHAGLDLAAHEAAMPGLVIWRAGCPPLFGIRKVESAASLAEDTDCTNANTQIRQSFGRIPGLDRILLVGRWSYYATGQGTGLDAGNRIAVYPLDAPVTEDMFQAAVVADAARDTVSTLRDWFDEVIVLRQPPEIPFYDSRRAAREAAHADWPFAARPVTESDVARATAEARAAAAEAPWRAMAEAGAIRLIDPYPRLCDADRCRALQDGQGFYFDNNHLTNSAAIALRDLFAPVFRSDGRQTALR